jgi:hypothetical protein
MELLSKAYHAYLCNVRMPAYHSPALSDFVNFTTQTVTVTADYEWAVAKLALGFLVVND